MHYICIRNQATRALSSAGSEHLVYTQRVGGSNPSAPTTYGAGRRKGKTKPVSINTLQVFFLYSSDFN